MTNTELKQFILKTAYNLGFSKVGIAPALPDPLLKKHLYSWLKNNYHATMKWMDNRFIERSDLLNYYPECKSIISIALNYFTGTASKSKTTGKISNYAWGDDYHNIIKPRLYKLLNEIKLVNQDVNGIVCVDTSPIMEKDWAQKAGLGWIGKHTNLITRDLGSWIFLGELLLDIELEYDVPFTEDLCGTCTACLDACPTNAFPQPYILDASKCISYLTIEHRGSFPNELKNDLSGWIYGCDICQEVCPWNIKFSENSTESAFQQRSAFQSKTIKDWGLLTKQEYKLIFKNSAIKRTKYEGLMRNIENTLNLITN